jgi:hypothetical protein
VNLGSRPERKSELIVKHRKLCALCLKMIIFKNVNEYSNIEYSFDGLLFEYEMNIGIFAFFFFKGGK